MLLLDEPGLSLHGKAQEDLLRYFEAEIASNPKHQLAYTTHSPIYDVPGVIGTRSYIVLSTQLERTVQPGITKEWPAPRQVSPQR